MTDQYNLIAQSDKSTIVARYIPGKSKATSYQSESELEKAFIKLLENQAYEYLPIETEEDLKSNLRRQLARLNNYTFSDNEWLKFFENEFNNKNEGIKEKTAKIQENHIRRLELDNGQTKNIYLIDKANIHNNNLQVINQYQARGLRLNRYDVTVLVNGLPLVHIELKRRGVAIKEAFNQINRYLRESFWADSGLFEYIQLFVISNGTHTKYYSNSTRYEHIQDVNKSNVRTGKKISNSFEFTNWWADAGNRRIPDLVDFSKTFFAKHSILSILTRYCVFTNDQQLLVMRPYQIAATERILNKITITTNYRKEGTAQAAGYVWHTTGSGKTLTSFKTAQLATGLAGVHKVLFVVDRKDLDYQTMAEYDKFEKGAANSNTSTAKLARQLKDTESRIIITTIQKLDRFIKQNQDHPIYNTALVLIFDECHRSQFGQMHRAVTKNFQKYHLFGFTGTPIFNKNAASSGRINLKTTEQVFGQQLHAYTIVDAINDENVLPFRVDYVQTIRAAEEIDDSRIRDIDREKALAAPERVTKVVDYICRHFKQKTKRQTSYPFAWPINSGVRPAQRSTGPAGFNSIFAVASIEMAKRYYREFQKQQPATDGQPAIKVATIFSYNINEPESDLEGLEDENPETVAGLDAGSRDFLETAITEYNRMFATNYDTSAEKFQNYYKDVSERMKNRQIDLLIVVNMFLTGFDAATLNTLWVDKNLRMHGLLQAYSRTNRILDSIKTFGNIVNFRNLEKATNQALSLFGDKNASGIVLLRPFKDYYYGYHSHGQYEQGYEEMIKELREKFPDNQQIIGEDRQKQFVRLYGLILKRINILSAFDDFAGQEILTDRDSQNYRSLYLDLYDKFRPGQTGDRVNINDDLVFEMELVKQVDINIDYILKLISQCQAANKDTSQLTTDIKMAIEASVGLRNKKDLIEQFIKSLTPESVVEADWQKFVNQSKTEELDKIIKDEDLDPAKTYKFIESAFSGGGIQTAGTAIAEILPALSRFDLDRIRAEKKQTVMDKLGAFFDKFFDISSEKFTASESRPEKT